MEQETGNVRLMFLRDQVGLVPSENYPDVAADLLVEGYDSPSLRELAGHLRNDPRGAADLWVQVREELGRPYEDDGDARRALVRHWLQQIVDGVLDPYLGTNLILGHAWHELGQPTELNYLVVLRDDWDDMPQSREDICNKIVEAAHEVLIDW
ncbi:hypothetical protein ACFVVC_04735 [Pseudarthrobacter sp. NPDC058196]|uniref:hypothetical protein n=1 Tax=Micrococcaceae TaxID=1268 RepID=UPI000A851556|nr:MULTISPECIES: hypothetical protein [unclassified Arthrobacter]TWD56052.1 hypothetical protein FB478_101196 [Arthrobacter sp. AG367]